MKEERTHIQFEDIKQRFGLVEKSHRIGEIDIKVSQVKRVDEMVAEIYPNAVTTHGDAPVWVITWPPAFGLAEYLLLNRLIMIIFYFLTAAFCENLRPNFSFQSKVRVPKSPIYPPLSPIKFLSKEYTIQIRYVFYALSET